MIVETWTWADGRHGCGAAETGRKCEAGGPSNLQWATASKHGRTGLNKAVHAFAGGHPGCCKILLYTVILSEYRWPFLGFRPGSLRIEIDSDVTQLFEFKYYIV